MGLLAGLRVLELGTGCAWGLKLLADLGAEVILVEPPGGSPARRVGPFAGETGESLDFGYFNTNKQSIVLDLDSAADRARLLALAERSAALVESYPPGWLAERGLGPADLAARAPGLIYLSVSPFGQTGPRRNWAADDLTLWALGGPMALCGLPDRPPLCPPIDVAGIVGGTYAAIGLLAALREKERSGRGQVIDLAGQEALASVSETVLWFFLHEGLKPVRMGTEHPATVPLKAFPTQDGAAYVIAYSEGQWRGLLDWLAETGRAEPLRDPRFLSITRRIVERDLVHQAVADWTRGQSTDAVFHAGQARHVPTARVSTPADVANDPHLAARGFFPLVAWPAIGRSGRFPGAPARFPPGSWSIRRPAPAPDADRAALLAALTEAPPGPPQPTVEPRERPLSGFRILDFTWVWAGPFATGLLADLGADVIKIEPIGAGDLNRHAPPFAGGDPDNELAGAHLSLNRGKRSLALNLRHPDGLAIARRLAAECDAVIENWSAGTLERLGLGDAELRRIRPDVILARLSGFGQDGPYRGYVSYAPALQGLAGLTHLTGYPDGTVAGPGIALSDFMGGLIGAFAILAAATARSRDGQGRTIDVGQFETSAALIGPALLDYLVNGHNQGPTGNQLPGQPLALRLVLPTAGPDRWLALSLPDDAAWQRLLALPNRPAGLATADWQSAAQRAGDLAAIESILAAWTAGQPAERLQADLQAGGLAAGIVQDGEDLMDDPQLAAREFFVDREHSRAREITLTRQPLIFSATPAEIHWPGPLLGGHAEEVLGELIGLTPAECAALRAAGVLG